MSGSEALRTIARRCTPRSFRNLARSPLATAGWVQREAAYLMGYRPTVLIRPGWNVRSHPVSLASFAKSAEDADLVAELNGFVSHCSPGMTFLDVGANYGLFCLAALQYGAPNAQVVTVDPSATSNRILRKNLDLAGVCSRVRVIEAAVGEADGTLSMLTTGPSGDHYLIAAPTSRADGRGVRQYSVTGLIELTGMKPTHIKIDVEGFERQVICGALPFLEQARPILFLELHGDMLRSQNCDPGAVLKQLVECGYRRVERNGMPIEPERAAALPVARLVCLPN